MRQSQRKKSRRSRKRPDQASDPASSLRFSPVNGVLGFASLAAIAIGYVLLAQGSVTLAPLLLVLGYAVLAPLAIIL